MASPKQYGAFIPTSYIWDLGELNDIEDIDPRLRELLVRLYQNLNNMALLLNIKDSGYYTQQEFVNSQLWFQNPVLTSTSSTNPSFRQVYRLVINFGALPNTATKSVAHNLRITPGYTFTRIYGAASDTTGFNYIPIPYASPVLANNIELRVDTTNVIITTGSNRSNFNITYVILEYLKF